MKHNVHICLLLFLFPSFAFASVRVTEVMYDLPGSDAGREWVEIVNDGSSIDLKDYKFFNKDGGHLLKAYGSGTTEVPAGAYVVIADKPDLFLGDNPGYTGLLIDSSFSLTSADTVGIKDADGAIVDSILYTSDLGGKGDGNSLQKNSSGTFVASTPSPGNGFVETASQSSSQTTTSSQNDSTSQSTSSPSTNETTQTSSSQKPDVPIKHITVDAGGDRVVTVGATSLFAAKVYGTAGEPIANPRLIWNFGNGEQREGKTISFAYEYPGVYILMVTGASGEYSAIDGVQVTAMPALVGMSIETDGAILLLNKERRDIDVSLWRLKRAEREFLIPENTILLGGQKIAFAMKTTNLPLEGDVVLMYPNGTEVLRASLSGTSTVVVAPKLAVVPTVAQKPKASGTSAWQSVSATAAVATAVAEVNKARTDQSSEKETVPWGMWLLGTVGLALLGAGGVVFMRMGGGVGSEKKTTAEIADTYEIIE